MTIGQIKKRTPIDWEGECALAGWVRILRTAAASEQQPSIKLLEQAGGASKSSEQQERAGHPNPAEPQKLSKLGTRACRLYFKHKETLPDRPTKFDAFGTLANPVFSCFGQAGFLLEHKETRQPVCTPFGQKLATRSGSFSLES